MHLEHFQIMLDLEMKERKGKERKGNEGKGKERTVRVAKYGDPYSEFVLYI